MLYYKGVSKYRLDREAQGDPLTGHQKGEKKLKQETNGRRLGHNRIDEETCRKEIGKMKDD